jgi:polyisoprenyl-phosphate glycosyltransferase
VVILILVTSGVNMLMLGVLGEYFWRAFDSIKARPDYVIREKSF